MGLFERDAQSIYQQCVSTAAVIAVLSKRATHGHGLLEEIMGANCAVYEASVLWGLLRTSRAMGICLIRILLVEISLL